MKKLILLSILFIVGCEEYAPTEHTHNEIYGCTNNTACNFNADANIYDGSCWYEDENCECDDGEGAIEDDCGICNADTSNDNTTCVQDCLGVWGGDAEYVDCVPGTYTLTTYMSYNNSDCSGDGENDLLPGSTEFQLILNSDGSGIQSATDLSTPDSYPVTLSLWWTLNGDQVTITYDSNENGIIDEDETSYYSGSLTFTEGSLKIQSAYEDSCYIQIFTKP